ncbi:MAG: hypothetical protein UU08_C0014G0021 [Candidatus Uhrbacteria bacterium GW2011_GWE2_40_58]|nr:MAG: hypothetical protein UT94_C0013G0027 [Candidatus Uhrbacteria bacterium GW2011_GWF2_40_263]KKR67564.1 MAG: hypothetical protein UU08_C0014G0021 [Candidatus Uhrbacteria bacterium GW2011_GWE2_40_58]
MSGGFGWIKNDGYSRSTQDSTRYSDMYDDALRGYGHVQQVNPPPSQQTPPPISAPRDLRQVASCMALSIPTALHALKSTASNVIIVVTDTTGSMGTKPPEIFKRLPRLYYDAAKYLGSDDLEILFMTHRDARTDDHAIQVTRFGRGQELDTLLASFYIDDRSGGGQGTESQELVTYYLLKQVDTSSARNVYCFFITDEAGCERVEEYLAQRELGLSVDPEFANTQAIFQMLKRRMNVYCVLFETTSYSGDLKNRIKPWWKRMLSPEGVLPLDDERRIVDVILGTLAVMTNQLAIFTKDLRSRQLPTQHGIVNVQSVMKSISMVGKGTDSDPFVPKPKTVPLLAGPAGTKSLLDR